MQPSPFWNDLAPSDPQFAVALIDRMLALAIAQNASDIHLQPRASTWEILFRIDGVLLPIGEMPRSELTDPVARLMVMAGLPSYRSNQPQEGRLSGSPAGIDMRLGTFPTVHGQRAVIRLFGASLPLESIDALSLSHDVGSDLIQLCDRRDGVVLMAGPAGSGKTTTLYACLRWIANGPFKRSVLTIEDPIEALLPGISQSQLNPATGMTLAAALRSAVRQDPEVLLVSEIRDEETADAVLVSSLTGHLCFSSIHASHCAGALRRLVQMELPAYLLRSGLLAICSQRLLRRLCTDCGLGSESTRASTCERCGGVGYQGRIAIAECVRFDTGEIGEAVMQCLNSDQSADRIHAAAVEAGMIDLQRRAWHLVEQRQTDAAEVYRVLGRQAGGESDR